VNESLTSRAELFAANPAMLDPPLAVASLASNAMSATTTSFAFFSVSATLPAALRTIGFFPVYAHVPPAHDHPPYTPTVFVNVTASAYVPSQT
jgi:hypothetical protein